MLSYFSFGMLASITYLSKFPEFYIPIRVSDSNFSKSDFDKNEETASGVDSAKVKENFFI